MTEIIIDGRKDTIFEFDVSIQGIAENLANVRFVIENKLGYEFSINCKKLKESKWQATIPPLENLQNHNKFRVEVIADGYYFCPAHGDAVLNNRPAVSMESFKPASKPTVETSLSFSMTPKKVLKEFNEISDNDKSVMAAKCEKSSVIFGKLSSVLRESKNINTKTLSKVLETIKKQLSSIEDIIT